MKVLNCSCLVVLFCGVLSSCTECKYETKTEEVYVSSFSLDDDSTLSSVYFAPLDTSLLSNWIWEPDDDGSTWVWINGTRLDKFIDLFSLETIEDTSIHYQINGNFILQGTCSPSSIESIELVSH